MGVDATRALELLDQAVLARNDETTGVGGQAAVGKILGCSGSLISQLQSVTYPSPAKWYRLIIEKFGNETVQCPYLGIIPLERCAEEKKAPFGAVSAAYARQRRACRTCEQNK